MGALWRTFVSMRATLVVLLALAGLLLLNIVVPQDAGATAARHAQLVSQGPVARFFLVTLGLGSIPTSPPFLATLGLFFANLVAVLADRTAAALRRARLRSPPADQVRRRLEAPDSLSGPPGRSDLQAGRRVLQRLGYRVTEIESGEGPALWAVKNRTASLGFLLFHASFLLLCAGGVMLAYTRNVAEIAVVEGDAFYTSQGAVLRRAPVAPRFRPPIALERVEVRLERGQPVALEATLRSGGPGEPAQVAGVNRPAEWDSLSVLVERAGIAPVLWLQDERGFTLERTAVAARAPAGVAFAEVPLAGGRLTARVKPIPVGEQFPTREQLPTTSVSLQLERPGERPVEARLRPGEHVAVGDLVLALQEVRYWAGFRLVDERGGAWLVAGFLVAVVGLVWRMLWYRRELLVGWGGDRLRLAGQAEFFPRWFQEEQAAIWSLLVDPPPEEPR